MKILKLTSIAASLLLMNSLVNPISCKAAEENPLNNQWSLTWSDEFDGDTINRSNWTFDIDGHGWGNNELEYYTDRPENARVEDGNLIIEARKEDYNGSQYTSARLKSEGLQNFLYGKIEARIKVPQGQGLWPAFWMLGSNMAAVHHPDCGEIDIMEHVNNENAICGTLHWNSNGMHSEGGQVYLDDVFEYHNYSIEWSPNYIKWFIDDNQYAEYDITNGANGTSSCHKPFFILLNLAVGGNWPKNPDSTTQFPAKMYVDYVRVYNKADSSSNKPRNSWYLDESDNSYYYLNGNSEPFKGWLYTKDYWYYLDNNSGKMITGWLYYDYSWYHLNSSGAMDTGWINDNGKSYYLNNSGMMIHDAVIDGHTIGSDGACIN